MTDPIPDLLNDAFDRVRRGGADSVDDPAVRAWLDEHPAALEAFAALRADLRTLPPRAGRRWRGAAAVAAATLAAAAIAAVLWPRAPRPLPRPLLADPSCIAFAATEVVVADDASTYVVSIEHGPGPSRRRDSFTRTIGTGAGAPPLTITLTTDRIELP